jgi:hypothetical protein
VRNHGQFCDQISLAPDSFNLFRNTARRFIRSRYATDSAGFRPASFISSASLCCLHSSAISAAISDRLVEKSDILEFGILQNSHEGKLFNLEQRDRVRCGIMPAWV